MRLIFAFPLLILAACNVENDEANDQMTLEYNEEQIEGAVADIGNTVEAGAESLGNIAEGTADAIGNEVGDVDVDVNADADADGNAQ